MTIVPRDLGPEIVPEFFRHHSGDAPWKGRIAGQDRVEQKKFSKSLTKSANAIALRS